MRALSAVLQGLGKAASDADRDTEEAIEDHDDGEKPEEGAEQPEHHLTPDRRLQLARQKLMVDVPDVNAIGSEAKKVTYPQNRTCPAFCGPGTPPISAATIAVAAAAAQPGQPSWRKPSMEYNQPQNRGPG